MIEIPEESEAFLKVLLQGSILNTPSRDFTAQLMVQVAQQKTIKVEMQRRVFQQALTMSIVGFLSILVCMYIGYTYFNFLLNLQLINSISTIILTASENVVSSIIVVYYVIIPIVLLWILDRLYLNLKLSD